MSNKRTEDLELEGRTFRLTELGYAKGCRLMRMKAAHEKAQAEDQFGEETVKAHIALNKEMLGPPTSGDPLPDEWYGDLSARQCNQAWDLYALLADSSDAKKNSPDGPTASESPAQQT